MKDLTQFLEQLALKLGVTAEYLWGALLKQAFISGIASSVFVFIILISGVILYLRHKRVIKCDKNDDLLEFGFPMLWILWGCLFLGGLFVSYNAITAFMNPEYWALKYILQSL